MGLCGRRLWCRYDVAYLKWLAEHYRRRRRLPHASPTFVVPLFRPGSTVFYPGVAFETNIGGLTPPARLLGAIVLY